VDRADVDDFEPDFLDDDVGGRVVGGGSASGPGGGAPDEPTAGHPPTDRDEAADRDGPDDRDATAGADGSRSVGETGAASHGAGGGGGVGHRDGGPGGVACFEVRTSYSSLLAGLARTWLDGTAKLAPGRIFLTGPRLRLWVIAAGSPHPAGWDLRLGDDDGAQVWAAVAAALAEAGLTGEIMQVEGGATVYRITGRRRLARLAESVGPRPPAVPAGRWPQT
jgi:hypothetical protein